MSHACDADRLFSVKDANTEEDFPRSWSYYRARYYDPTVGRFLNEDPSSFESDDLNFYSYVGK